MDSKFLLNSILFVPYFLNASKYWDALLLPLTNRNIYVYIKEVYSKYFS